MQKLDVNLSVVNDIALFYQSDWELIEEYAHVIGEYAQPHVLHHLNVPQAPTTTSLRISSKAHALLCTPNKKITSGDVGLADVFTFEISPYSLFPMAQVFRRDNLPSLVSSVDEPDYQRPLMKDKINMIRKILIESLDFMFPNSVLVIMSDECKYRAEERFLDIPNQYGSFAVIDGQHRLFAYADKEVRGFVGDEARIMVTAVKFHETDARKVSRYSAATFVQINTSQTPVKSGFLDAISYDVLGDTTPRSLASEAIVRLNSQQGKMCGMFNTNHSSRGIIQTNTVQSALESIFNLVLVNKLLSSRRATDVNRKNGYVKLFDLKADLSMIDAEALLDKGVVCLKKYFGYVSSTFNYDWPNQNAISQSNSKTALQNTKMFAALIKLLNKFIAEGLDWQKVQEELTHIRTHIMQLRGLTKYTSILLDVADSKIPGTQASVSDDLKFLDANRSTPTQIATVQGRTPN